MDLLEHILFFSKHCVFVESIMGFPQAGTIKWMQNRQIAKQRLTHCEINVAIGFNLSTFKVWGGYPPPPCGRVAAAAGGVKPPKRKSAAAAAAGGGDPPPRIAELLLRGVNPPPAKNVYCCCCEGGLTF